MRPRSNRVLMFTTSSYEMYCKNKFLLSWNKFFVNEWIFKLTFSLWKLQGIRDMLQLEFFFSCKTVTRDRFRTAATSKMERFVIIVNCWKPLDIARANNALYYRSAFKVAALQRCSYRKVFWKNAANLEENTNAEMWFQVNKVGL